MLGFCPGEKGRGHYTKNISRLSDVNSVNPFVLDLASMEKSLGKSSPALRGESSSYVILKGCSSPGIHYVGSFPGIQPIRFGLFLSHSCSNLPLL